MSLLLNLVFFIMSSSLFRTCDLAYSLRTRLYTESVNASNSDATTWFFRIRRRVPACNITHFTTLERRFDFESRHKRMSCLWRWSRSSSYLYVVCIFLSIYGLVTFVSNPSLDLRGFDLVTFLFTVFITTFSGRFFLSRLSSAAIFIPDHGENISNPSMHEDVRFVCHTSK